MAVAGRQLRKWGCCAIQRGPRSDDVTAQLVQRALEARQELAIGVNASAVVVGREEARKSVQECIDAGRFLGCNDRGKGSQSPAGQGGKHSEAVIGSRSRGAGGVGESVLISQRLPRKSSGR